MSFVNNEIEKQQLVSHLNELFGSVLEKEIIESVLLNCDYEESRTRDILLELARNADKSFSTANSSLSIAKNKPVGLNFASSNSLFSPWFTSTSDLERVISIIQKGYKVLVLLRGLPGSGKSTLAKVILDRSFNKECTINSTNDFIKSTDNYFMKNGTYNFNHNLLSEAHNWNQTETLKAMRKGVSPIIIDNTNVQMWEMKSYAMMAVENGYIIEIIEPSTRWAFNASQLAHLNKHKVSKKAINDMLLRYDKNVTPKKLTCVYNLHYVCQIPQMRRYPPLPVKKTRNNINFKSKSQVENGKSHVLSDLMDFSDKKFDEPSQVQVSPNKRSPSLINEILGIKDEENNFFSDNKVLNPEIVPNNKDNESESITKKQKNFYSNLDLSSWKLSDDVAYKWEAIVEKTTEKQTNDSEHNNLKQVTSEASTNTCPRDFFTNDSCTDVKLLYGRNRDINEGNVFHLPPVLTKTPVMLDKSCTTEDNFGLSDTEISSVHSKHLMNIFPDISLDLLQEVYQKCNKDLDWTIDLLLEGNLEVIDNIHQVNKTKEDDFEMIEDKEGVQKILTEEIKISGNDKISENIWDDKIESVIDLEDNEWEKFDNNVQNTCDSTSQSNTEEEDMMELNLGDILVSQLEEKFGNSDLYPKGFQPVVQVPITLAKQLFAFYLESVYTQMETQNQIFENLVREDEKYAKQLQENESNQQETCCTDNITIKEIIDQEKAKRNYEKQVERQWMNLTPNDLAAKLTRQKLFQNFPDIEEKVLVEILQAHDNCYEQTVQVLLRSITENNAEREENAATSQILEPPISSTTLQEMNQAKQETEENYEIIDQDNETKSPNMYREEAKKYLTQKHELLLKAQKHYQKGEGIVATYYSNLANKMGTLYEKANALAAHMFLNDHVAKNNFHTLDLHYLFVKEAISALDIFVDRNIMLLSGKNTKNQELFIITGRGKGSKDGKSKLRPAVISHLKKRKLNYSLLNPGLLKIYVNEQSIMTNDIRK